MAKFKMPDSIPAASELGNLQDRAQRQDAEAQQLLRSIGGLEAIRGGDELSSLTRCKLREDNIQLSDATLKMTEKDSVDGEDYDKNERSSYQYDFPRFGIFRTHIAGLRT